MNESWHDSAETVPTVLTVQGRPRPGPEGLLTLDDVGRFRKTCGHIMRALKGPIRLLKYVVGARVAREGSTARRTAEEAAEIAAHREEREASTELIRQQATGQYIANLRETADLPPHLQPLAIAKIVKDDPTVLEQVNRIEEVMRDLGTRCGTRIEVVSGPAVIQTNEPPETPELEAPGKAE